VCVVEAHGPHWLAWPEELRNPATPEVAARRAELADRVDFHTWLQWQLDEQLAGVAADAAAAGMAVGVIGDLAVGVHPGGADSWALQDVLAVGASVGAPPDAFNHYGQDWSQPPWKPRQLAEAGYAPYRDLLRAGLRHGGGLRVDHVLGLFRLWWVPPGAKPRRAPTCDTTTRPSSAFSRWRRIAQGAVVIGEDLGTVEPWVRDYLAERGMLAPRFSGSSAMRRPAAAAGLRRMCLGTVTTTICPRPRGYLTGNM